MTRTVTSKRPWKCLIIYTGYTSAIKTERSKAGYHDFWSLNFNLNAQALYYRQYLERSLSTKCIWFWYKYLLKMIGTRDQVEIKIGDREWISIEFISCLCTHAPVISSLSSFKDWNRKIVTFRWKARVSKSLFKFIANYLVQDKDEEIVDNQRIRAEKSGHMISWQALGVYSGCQCSQNSCQITYVWERLNCVHPSAKPSASLLSRLTFACFPAPFL